MKQENPLSLTPLNQHVSNEESGTKQESPLKIPYIRTRLHQMKGTWEIY